MKWSWSRFIQCTKHIHRVSLWRRNTGCRSSTELCRIHTDLAYYSFDLMNQNWLNMSTHFGHSSFELGRSMSLDKFWHQTKRRPQRCRYSQNWLDWPGHKGRSGTARRSHTGGAARAGGGRACELHSAVGEDQARRWSARCGALPLAGARSGPSQRRYAASRCHRCSVRQGSAGLSSGMARGPGGRCK